MKLKEFFEKYGTDTTTNIELLNIAKNLGLKNFYYVMRDEVKDLPKDKKPLNVMTNIHTSKENGVHHSSFYICDKRKYFFDSYGLKPTKEVKDFIGDGYSSKFIIQKPNTRYCGQMSLYVLHQLNTTDKSFFDIILDIKNECENTS